MISMSTVNGVDGNIITVDEDIFAYMKILVLLFVDDTVVFSHLQQNMQNVLEIFKSCCDS